MPTHRELERFLREFASLTPQQKTQFLAAVRKMVEDLKASVPLRPSLRVKGVQGHPDIFEMTWMRNGRATFQYGAEIKPGKPTLSGVALVIMMFCEIPNSI